MKIKITFENVTILEGITFYVTKFQRMDILVWCLLVSAASPNPTADARRFLRPSRPHHSRADQLRNKDIAKALSLLLSDNTETEDMFADDEETDAPKERGREARQFPGFENPLGNCEITGYETNIREECTEVSNVECKKINVTMSGQR